MYFDKEVVRGYNEYLKMGVNDHETGMDVGLLVLEPGDGYTFEEPEKELAVDLLQGKVIFAWDGQTLEADRPDTFHYDAYCLHVCRGTKVEIRAVSHAELYVQMTDKMCIRDRASRIPGVSPGDITVLMIYLRTLGGARQQADH